MCNLQVRWERKFKIFTSLILIVSLQVSVSDLQIKTDRLTDEENCNFEYAAQLHSYYNYISITCGLYILGHGFVFNLGSSLDDLLLLLHII